MALGGIKMSIRMVGGTGLSARIGMMPIKLTSTLSANMKEFAVALKEEILDIADHTLKNAQQHAGEGNPVNPKSGVNWIGYEAALSAAAWRNVTRKVGETKAGRLYEAVTVSSNVHGFGSYQAGTPEPGSGSATFVGVGVRIPDNIPYAWIIEKGGTIPPHRITAKNAKALYFQGYGYIPYAAWHGSYEGRIMGAKSKPDMLGTPEGKFSPGDFNRLAGGGFGYHFMYPMARTANHPGATFKGYQIINKAIRNMAGEFHDLILTSISQTVGGVTPEANNATTGLDYGTQMPGLVKSFSNIQRRGGP